MPAMSKKLVGPIGLGLAKLTTPPNFPTETQAIECLRAAAESDCLVWNAGEFYGPRYYNSLVLLERFFTQYPQYAERVVLNVKGAMLPTFTPSGNPEVIKKSVENCVHHLGGKKWIDMFETARVVTDVPLQVQMHTLSGLVEERKIGGVALTEVSAGTIEMAAKLVHIEAVEVELSLWCVDPLHNGILRTCKKLDIPVMAYCPLGRGFLAGALKSRDDIPQSDLRRILPRYDPNNFDHNLILVKEIEKFAARKGCTAAQVALGWILGLSARDDMPVIVPIPGTTSVDHVRENAAATALSEAEMRAVDDILRKHRVVGERYHPHGMKHVNM